MGAAVGGHAFGAGMMFAVGHDYRLQADGRGFMCAIEVEIGVGIPAPELELFGHCMPKPDFYDTVMGAKRRTAADALRAGLIVKASSQEALLDDALAFAESKAKLGKGERMRKNFMHIKDSVKGHVQKMLMDASFPNGAFPPMAAHVSGLEKDIRGKYP